MQVEHVCFVPQPAKQPANLVGGAVHDEQGQADGAGLASHRVEAVQESPPCAHRQILLVDVGVRLHRLDNLQQERVLPVDAHVGRHVDMGACLQTLLGRIDVRRLARVEQHEGLDRMGF